MQLIRDTQPLSSQFADPLWTDLGLKSGISVLELISTLKRKKHRQEVEPSAKNFAREEEATTTSSGVVLLTE